MTIKAVHESAAIISALLQLIISQCIPAIGAQNNRLVVDDFNCFDMFVFLLVHILHSCQIDI